MNYDFLFLLLSDNLGILYIFAHVKSLFAQGYEKPRHGGGGEVIPLGLEPRTHSLEGCCSNPTELRNRRGEK